MKCPFCKAELVKSENKRFENLSDHVSDPNGEYERPLRPTFVCSGNCEMSNGGFWDEQGGRYGGTYDYVKMYYWSQKHGGTDALGSWDRWMSNEHAFARKIGKLIFWDKYGASYNIARWIFKFFEPKFSANE